jgi:transcriptional regulator with XRE-family HTH domain
MNRNALQELIHNHCQETGETLSDIAARGGLARQTVSAIAHRDDPGAIPRRVTLAKLATGLGLPLEIVERAAALAAQVGTGELDGDMTQLRLDVLVSHARGLNDDEIEVLVAAARALKTTRRHD